GSALATASADSTGAVHSAGAGAGPTSAGDVIIPCSACCNNSKFLLMTCSSVWIANVERSDGRLTLRPTASPAQVQHFVILGSRGFRCLVPITMSAIAVPIAIPVGMESRLAGNSGNDGNVKERLHFRLGPQRWVEALEGPERTNAQETHGRENDRGEQDRRVRGQGGNCGWFRDRHVQHAVFI